MPRSVGGDIRGYQLSPDGERVVYVADQELDERFDLFAAKVTSGGPTSFRLNTPSSFGDVEPDFQISPDSRRVVYRADVLQNGRIDLYSVALRGVPSPVRLDGQTRLGGAVREFAISPDGRAVAYTADQDRGGVFELYRVPSDGSLAPIKLSGPILPPSGDVLSMRFSPDGRRVVYLAEAERAGVSELYSVPGGGGVAVKLNGVLPAGNLPDVGADYQISPDGLAVVYRADQDQLGKDGLYRVPIEGGVALLKLADFPVYSFRIGSDGNRVAFSSGPVNDNQLFSVPLAGGAPPVPVGGPFVAGGGVLFQDFEISPDGRTVVYVAEQETAGVYELFSAPITGGPGVKLNGPMVLRGSFSHLANPFRISSDSLRVVFRVDQETDSKDELFSAPVDGSSPAVKLNGVLPAGSDVHEFLLSADARRAVYSADQDVDGVEELFSAPIDGSAAPVPVSGQPTPGGDVTLAFNGTSVEHPFVLGADSRTVVYLADQEIDEVVELFAAPIDGSRGAVRVNRELAVGPIDGDVSSLLSTRAGAFAVYVADQDTDEAQELYSVATDGRSRPVKLSGAMVEGGDIYRVELSPDDAWVVYVADQLTYDVHEIFSAAVDGRGAPVRLSGPLVPGGDAYYVEISRDSRRVVYRADQELDNVQEVYSVHIDGSSPAVKLSSALVAGGSVAALEIAPDSLRVVYLADQDTDDVRELYAAPIDGSAPALKLNSALAAGGDVFSLAISPDGQRVAYTARQDDPVRRDVYVVPIDGSSAPIRVGGAHDAPYEVEFTPDGSRIVYRATTSHLEIYSVPSDGSAPPVKLNPPVLSGYGVRGSGFSSSRPWQFTPDGSRVLFLAELTANKVELYSVPSAGGSAAVKLNGFLPGYGSVQGIENSGYFRISPDGSRVLFLVGSSGFGTQTWGGLHSAPVDGSGPDVTLNAGRLVLQSSVQPTTDGTQALFLGSLAADSPQQLLAQPIDGSAPAVALNGELVGGGNVTFLKQAGKDHVLYFGDQRQDEVFELFLGFLGRPKRATDAPSRTVSPGSARL